MKMSMLAFAFTLSMILNYLFNKLFKWSELYDKINNRSSHSTAATRTGGIGIFSAMFFTSVFFYLSKIEIFDYSLIIPLAIMFVIGVYDDLYNADFKLKFLIQIIVAKILIDQGLVITNFYGFLYLNEVPWLLAQFTTVLIFLIIVNAINFIDGIDTLAVGQVLKTLVLVEIFASYSSLTNLNLIVILTLFPLFFFNISNKSKVFLGDAGSLYLGTILAINCFYILGGEFNFKNELSINKTLFSILILLYPLFDLLRVFYIRLTNGKSPFVADKNHLHHLILNKIGGKHWVVSGIITILDVVIITIIYIIYQKNLS